MTDTMTTDHAAVLMTPDIREAARRAIYAITPGYIDRANRVQAAVEFADAALAAVVPMVRAATHRDAASYLLRRAAGEDGLGEHFTAHGYRAAAEALRGEAERMVTTERQGAERIRETDDADV